MFIQSPNTRYTKHGEQVAGPALFLILISGESKDRQHPKAVVRKVKLTQCGHYMMGTTTLFGHKEMLSGAYGSDGLLCTVPDQIYDAASTLLPQELYDAWSNGGGWNSAGSEAQAMTNWALDNLKELQRNSKLPAGGEGIPNLEGMSDSEIRELDLSIFRNRKSLALQWFGDARSEWISNVSSMCRFIADARRHRLAGEIDRAIYLESLFDEHYHSIPAEFRY